MSDSPTTDRRWPHYTLRALFAVVSGAAIAIVTGPIVTLVLLYLAFLASLQFSSKRLPDVVKTLQGQRLPRQSYLTSMLFVGLWGPLFPAGLMALGMAKELTASMVILMAWAACALLVIVIAVHWKTVSVNPQAATQ